MELISASPIHEANQRERELCIQYGSSASEAMFDFPCHFFNLPDCTGTIAYRIESNCAVVFGDPICPPQETEKLAEGFYRHCQASGLNIIYIIVSEKFAKWAKSSHCSILIEVCEEFIFDPAVDPCLSSHRLQHRVDKAVKHGLTVHEYIPFDAEVEKNLKQVGEKWQQAIKGPHIYLGHLNFFESYVGKRWFYVKDGGRITSMAMLSRVEANQGWLLKFLATLPDAFHDTSEFLVTSVLSILRKENCRFLTKGMMPVDALGEISGFGAAFKGAARGIYKIINWTFKFNKRKEYWLRYHPQSAPAYLLFSNPSIGLNEIKALIKAFRT